MNKIHYVHKIRDMTSNKGAYATTEIYVFTKTNFDDTDTFVQEFAGAFRKDSSRYYNLRRLTMYASYEIMDGALLKEILSAPSPCTELNLNICAFHTPIEDMWVSGVAIQKLDITFNDGVAFPNSGTDILKGMDKNKALQEIIIRNASPHKPTVNVHHSMRRKVNQRLSSGVNFKFHD